MYFDHGSLHLTDKSTGSLLLGRTWGAHHTFPTKPGRGRGGGIFLCPLGETSLEAGMQVHGGTLLSSLALPDFLPFWGVHPDVQPTQSR